MPMKSALTWWIKYAIANLNANEVCPLPPWWIKYAIANLDANKVCPLFWWIKYAIANLDANEVCPHLVDKVCHR